MTDPHETGTPEEIPAEVLLAFAPIHKRAFGLALGLTMGTALFAATCFAVLRSDAPGFMFLLGNYFPGYGVSWTGAVLGFVWAAFAFFIGGWFFAFVRNLVIATSIWIARTRAELRSTRDFLDHI